MNVRATSRGCVGDERLVDFWGVAQALYDSVSPDIISLDWNVAVLRRRDVRGVDADMVPLEEGDPALRRSNLRRKVGLLCPYSKRNMTIRPL